MEDYWNVPRELIYRERENLNDFGVKDSHSLNGRLFQLLSEQFGLDPVYITRATKELADHGLLEERKVGRNSFVYRTMAAKDLFELSKPFLANPVHEVIHVRKEKAVESMPFAADEALSHLGMLNPPEISVRACYRKNDVIKALK